MKASSPMHQMIIDEQYLLYQQQEQTLMESIEDLLRQILDSEKLVMDKHFVEERGVYVTIATGDGEYDNLLVYAVDQDYVYADAEFETPLQELSCDDLYTVLTQVNAFLKEYDTASTSHSLTRKI